MYIMGALRQFHCECGFKGSYLCAADREVSPPIINSSQQLDLAVKKLRSTVWR